MGWRMRIPTVSALVSAATALSSLCACLISCSPVAFADSTGYLNCLNTSIGYSGSTDSALSLGRIAYNAIQGGIDPGDEKIALMYGFHLPLVTAAAIVNCANTYNPN